MTLPTSVIAAINKYVQFHEVEDNDTWQVGDLGLQCFDIASTKEKQYGFRALLPDGQTLVCLGDEPYNERNRTYAEGADWLLCEAFCLYKDRERFKPYEKHHSTALDAGRLAQQLGVKNLLLYHTEDKTLDTRKKSYTEETSLEFTGTVHVPDDLERYLSRSVIEFPQLIAIENILPQDIAPRANRRQGVQIGVRHPDR